MRRARAVPFARLAGRVSRSGRSTPAGPGRARRPRGDFALAGFAEAPQAFPGTGLSGPVPAPHVPDRSFTPREGVAPPFPSTGPHGHRGRMREKLLERGPEALADYELLEMLLFFAFKTGDTKPMAKSLINRYGSFAAVLAAPQQTLLDTRGLGPHSVAAIKLVRAAALRLARAEVMDRPVLNNWDRLVDYLTAALAREPVECFHVLYLDSRNRLIADEAQARGTVNHTPVYPREVVKRALEVQATAMILVHNHPSGDPTPSRADIEMTAEVKAAAGVFGIVLHDHLIVGNGRQTSLRREGLL
ncbi:RadC family protein [Siccirubricoccus sp. G192]|uniref:RadC family protein n=1 Tax=Siccirubricoccus sp. G192 TaxID=2849651 RepID=UPI0020C1C8A7|nr:DNA repair protein RadC [Siccirubricoccus sp. G192]